MRSECHVLCAGMEKHSGPEQVFGSFFGKEAAMTAVDKIRQEGIEKARESFVKKILEKGTMSLEEISRTFDLDLLLWVKELAGRLRET